MQLPIVLSAPIYKFIYKMHVHSYKDADKYKFKARSTIFEQWMI